MLDSFSLNREKEVKAKPLEALKKLGHEKLELDEYESASVCSHSWPERSTWFRNYRI